MRIAVPFGKNKIYTALAIELHQNAPTLYEAKEIHQILDENPIVNEFQINHWFWIAAYYMGNIGDVKTMSQQAIAILENDETLQQFKTNAAEHAKKFDIHMIVPLYEDLYQRFLQKAVLA